MKISINETSAVWVCDDKRIRIKEPYNIHQAMYGEDIDSIVVLVHHDKQCYINLYSKTGVFKKRIQESDQITFNCLGAHIKHDVAVLGKTYKMGWVDWWYSINPTNGELESIGEGR